MKRESMGDVPVAPTALADRRRDLEIVDALRTAAHGIWAKSQGDAEVTITFRDEATASAFWHQLNRLTMDDAVADFVQHRVAARTPDGGLVRFVPGRFPPPVDEQDG